VTDLGALVVEGNVCTVGRCASGVQPALLHERGPVSADRLATVLHVRRPTVLAALLRSWRTRDGRHALAFGGGAQDERLRRARSCLVA